jgi:cation diffusion facilitator family transporter
MASLAILVFLIIVMVEVISSAVDRVLHGGTPKVFPEGIALMSATLVVNLIVVAYETRAGRRLKSELLLADAKHTRSDVLTTIAVIGALIGVWAGHPLFDPIAALFVAAFIGHACWEIAQQASRILADTIVIAEEDVRAVIATVPEVLGCEKIRTRGSSDHAFLDLHLWLDGNTPLVEAHSTSHVVKDLLMARFPQLADVVIHIEPPPLRSSPSALPCRRGVVQLLERHQPALSAWTMAWARFSTCSFDSTRATCVFTVSSPMSSVAAISRFDRPSARCRRTSSSRPVSSSRSSRLPDFSRADTSV